MNMLSRFMRISVTLTLGTVLLAGSTLAATKTYQVTGQVLESTDTKLVVQKGKEKWEILRDKDTKVEGQPKVGSKVTVDYTMTAADITTKEPKTKGGTTKQ